MLIWLYIFGCIFMGIFMYWEVNRPIEYPEMDNRWRYRFTISLLLQNILFWPLWLLIIAVYLLFFTFGSLLWCALWCIAIPLTKPFKLDNPMREYEFLNPKSQLLKLMDNIGWFLFTHVHSALIFYKNWKSET